MLKTGSTYRVSSGTLTFRRFTKEGKQNFVTAWYESHNGEQYSQEVSMSEENFKKVVKRRI